MAKRKVRRRRTAGGRFVAKNAPRRRRRRVRRNALGPARRAAVAVNAPRRRRRRRHLAHNPPRSHRRRLRRNPPGGIVGTIIQGLKDGGAVVVGQVGTRKIRGAVTGMLPDSVKTQVASGMGQIALNLASAVAVTLIARKALPRQASYVAAGAFSETINAALAQTPVAPFLGAFPPRRIVPVSNRVAPRLGAYVQSGYNVAAGRGLGAYPGTMRAVGLAGHHGAGVGF